MRPELKAALSVVNGHEPARAHRPEFPPRAVQPFPNAPPSLAGGAMALSSKYAWSEWGGVPTPGEALQPPVNPDDAARLEQRARAATERPGGGQRVQERAEARQRFKVQQVLDTLRAQVEMQGSVAAAFRKLEVSGDAKISHDELKKSLKHRFNIEMSDETTRRVVREFDADGDGEIEYKEFVQRLLGKCDVGERGMGINRHAGVEMSKEDADQKEAAKQHASDVGDLDVHRRHEAAVAMERMKQRLQTKYANVRDAFRSIDVDSDNTLSYAEFGGLVSEWLPELAPERVKDVCRLIDADGDGMIDFDEFGSVMAAQGDDMRQSAAGVLRRREQKQLQNMTRAKGCVAAPPCPASAQHARIRRGL